ncbi:EB module [Trichuris suis]|nr:EB module [Trichuris suis]
MPRMPLHRVSLTVVQLALICAFRVATERCEDHKDCKGRYICVDRLCIPAKPTGMRCLSKSQCDSPKEECKYNHCWLPEERSNMCTTDRDCSENMICVQGQCVHRSQDEQEQGERMKLGKVGQRCVDGHSCRISNSYCILGYCQCKMNSVYDGMKCVQLAEIGDRCGEENLPCRPENSECFRGSCVCKSGFKPEAGNCVRTTRAELSQKCTVDDECVTSYAHCEGGRCNCREGIKQTENRCRPNYNCLIGSVLVDNGGKTRKCIVNAVNEQEITGDLSECPDSYYCIDMGSTSVKMINQKRVLVRTGVCCPSFGPVCPAGDRGIPTSKEQCNTECPTRSHFCLVDQNIPNLAVCCIKPCSGNDIFSDGSCHTQLRIGEPCETPAQCTLSKSYCLPYSGNVTTCQCTDKEIEWRGECIVPKCQSNRSPVVDKFGKIARCNASLPPCQPGTYCEPNYEICCRGRFS